MHILFFCSFGQPRSEPRKLSTETLPPFDRLSQPSYHAAPCQATSITLEVLLPSLRKQVSSRIAGTSSRELLAERQTSVHAARGLQAHDPAPVYFLWKRPLSLTSPRHSLTCSAPREYQYARSTTPARASGSQPVRSRRQSRLRRWTHRSARLRGVQSYENGLQGTILTCECIGAPRSGICS